MDCDGTSIPLLLSRSSNDYFFISLNSWSLININCSKPWLGCHPSLVFILTVSSLYSEPGDGVCINKNDNNWHAKCDREVMANPGRK